MARKKRAWNSSNPLYRWLHSHKRGKRVSRSTRRKARTRRVVRMARGRRSRRSSGGGFGLGGGRKLFALGGTIGGAVLGLGIAALAKRFVGAPLGNYTGAAAGFAVGGIPGAIGGYVHDNIGNIGGAASGGGGAQTVYG